MSDRLNVTDAIRGLRESLHVEELAGLDQPSKTGLSIVALTTLAALAMDGNKDKITSAPVVAIIGYDIDFHEQLPWLFPHTDAKSWFEGDVEGRITQAKRNSALQGAYLMIAARALGLDCGPMSGFDSEAVDKAFFADQPRHRTPVFEDVRTIGNPQARARRPTGRVKADRRPATGRVPR